jgi:hypothetical protein
MPKLHADIDALAHCAADSRADGGVRTVWLTPRGVRIERAVSGVKMRLVVPIEAYQGVLLTCQDTVERPLCRIILAHSDPDLSVSLHQGADTPAILEIWQGWARFLSRPALCAGTSVLHNAAACPRRRGVSLAKRRPRNLLRRRPARLAAPAKVLRVDRELFSWE